MTVYDREATTKEIVLPRDPRLKGEPVRSSKPLQVLVDILIHPFKWVTVTSILISIINTKLELQYYAVVSLEYYPSVK